LPVMAGDGLSARLAAPSFPKMGRPTGLEPSRCLEAKSLENAAFSEKPVKRHIWYFPLTQF